MFNKVMNIELDKEWHWKQAYVTKWNDFEDSMFYVLEGATLKLVSL